MYKYIYPLIKWKIKPWLKYYIVKKGEGTPSEIITLASPITLANSLRRKFIKFIVGGNSVQDGEPSTINEVPIQNVTGDVKFNVENENIYNVNNTSVVGEGVTVDEEGWITVSSDNSAGTSSKYVNYYTKPSKVLKPNTQYTVVTEIKDFSGTFNTLNIVDSASTSQSATNVIYQRNNLTQNSKNVSQFTTKSNLENKTTMIRSYVMFSAGQSGSVTFRISVLEDTSMTAEKFKYVPHEEQTVTFPLSEGQILHEGDTIEDKIVQRRKTVIFDGTENWKVHSSTWHRYYIEISDVAKGGEILSNYFTREVKLQDHNREIYSKIDTGYYNSGFIFIQDFTFTTLQDFKDWLAEKYSNGTPVIVEYELDTPVEIEFSQAQATAKAQIDNLYSYKGTTYISSTNEPSPIFEVQYYMEEGG